MQVYSKANIWDVGPMGQFVRDVRSVDPEATGNPLQVYEASRQMKRSFEQAAWYALLAIIPVGAARLPPAQPHAAGGAADGRRHVANARPDGPARHPAESGQHDRAAADARPRHGHAASIWCTKCAASGGRYRGAGNAVIVAVVVNTLTTMVGFGALMIANHQGLQSLGRVLTISMGCCLLNSLLLPNLLVIGRFAAGEPAEQNPSRADDSADIESDDSVPASFDEYYERYSDRIAA